MLCGQHRQCYVGEMFDEKFEILSAELHKKLVTTLAWENLKKEIFSSSRQLYCKQLTTYKIVESKSYACLWYILSYKAFKKMEKTLNSR